MASALMGDGVRGIIGICRARFTLLNDGCRPPGWGTGTVGPTAGNAATTTFTATNAEFVTDAVMNITLARQYRTVAEAEKVSCAGKNVLWHRPESKVLKQIDISGTIGVFDPEFQSYVLGHTALHGRTGAISTNYHAAMDNKIVGLKETIDTVSNSLPPQVGVEIWQETVGPGLTGLCSTTSAETWVRHVFPMTMIYAGDSQELGADGGVEFAITGTSVVNPNYFFGSHPQTWVPQEYMDDAPYGWFYDEPGHVPAAATGVQTINPGS